MPVRILLEGRPGSGKTTVARRLIELLRDRDVSLAGFTTEEIRERGRRVGFAIETMAGERATLAHVRLPGPPRVGKYGVDVETFERVAIPALAVPVGTVVIVDGLGKMELASTAFRAAVDRLLDGPSDLLATVHTFRHPITDGWKARGDVEVLAVTATNRDELPTRLAERLADRS